MAGSVAKEVLARLGIAGDVLTGDLVSVNPATGEELGRVRQMGPGDYDALVDRCAAAFERWRLRPAPERGLIVREIGETLRRHKDDLGALLTPESGKILAEGRG